MVLDQLCTMSRLPQGPYHFKLSGSFSLAGWGELASNTSICQGGLLIGIEHLLGGALSRVLACPGNVGIGGNKTANLVTHVVALGLLMLMSYEVWK